MSTHFLALLVMAMCFELAGARPLDDTRDYAKEALVIQNMTTEVSFSQDGAREWRQTLSARVQSEGMLRQIGVLSFAYSAANEEIKVEYVRVKKADGSVVATPDSSIVDTTAEIAASAPTYSDLRQKQIPVKALGVGDVLEYSVRSSQRKPEVPGHFWYEQVFPDDTVVLSESLEIRVPKEKLLQISSPKLKYETRDDGDQRVYIWKYNQLTPSKPQDNQKQTEATEPPKVRLTTFKNWEEVGSWWGALAGPEAAVTLAIQDKAKELTAGLSTDGDKAKAIYKYVSMKFRYISISFGAGRYRPHSAEAVLTNQYGDCKDKHTLFTALLKAAGIEAWPALVGVGIKFDSGVPSPSQFNHVITVIPQDGKNVWLDTTQEVAPFGLLGQVIRDEQALVIPANGKPFLLKTPLDPPFRTSETIDVKSSLAEDGTLTGHFDLRMLGDNASAFRSGFRQLAPSQWQAMTQQMSFALNYAGEVSGAEVENLDDLDKPFHLTYEYTRKKYSDWENARITPPLPPLGFGPGDEADKPKEPFWAGSPGDVTYRASMVIPKGFFLEPPQNVSLTSEFADYSAQYSFKDGTFFSERKMTIKKSKVTLDQWANYQKFAKGVRTDQAQFLPLGKAEEKSSVTAMKDDAEARLLLQRAGNALRAENMNEARDLLRQVESINPKQAGLWSAYGFIEMRARNNDQAIADLRKELLFHPDDTKDYDPLSWLLIQASRPDEAIDLWKSALAKNPADEKAASEAGGLLLRAKRYAEASTLLEKSVAAAPQNTSLQTMLFEALLRAGRKDEATAQAQTIAASTPKPATLNSLAYALADTDSALSQAQAWAEQAVAQTENDCGKNTLTNFGKEDLAAVTTLAEEWDTLGWAYYKQNNSAKAEKYLLAAWQLIQDAAIADHLAQIYEKQGKHDAAIHMWRLALAANGKQEGALAGLRNAHVPLVEPPPSRNRPTNQPTPAAELSNLRFIKIPALPKQRGSAEFFLLISNNGIEDVRFISGTDSLKTAGSAIQAAKYKFPFPDDGPEKIIRRGILSCSIYTDPSCQFVMLLPATVTIP